MPTSLLIEISADTMDHFRYGIIMSIVWDFLDAQTKSWKQISKTLTLLDFLVKIGSEKSVEASRNRIQKIRSLQEYTCYEGKIDHGTVIREKAKLFCELLSSNELIRSEREKSRVLRQKFDDTSSQELSRGSHQRYYDDSRLEINRNVYDGSIGGNSGGVFETERSSLGIVIDRPDNVTAPPLAFGEDSYYIKASNPSNSSNSKPQVPFKLTDVLNVSFCVILFMKLTR